MALSIDQVRNILDEMKSTARELNSIDSELKSKPIHDTRLYEQQFQLILRIIKLFEGISEALEPLINNDETTFIARRLQRQADLIIGERKHNELK